MRRGRIVGSKVAILLAALVFVPSALAATPDEIARDLEDGTLDGTYTQAELRAFFSSANVQIYQPGEQDISGVAGAERSGGVAGAERVGGVAGQEAVQPQQRGVLPFTGLDLALMTAGGIGLLGLGAGMRRLARDRH